MDAGREVKWLSAFVHEREIHSWEKKSMRLRLCSFLAILGCAILSSAGVMAQEKLSWKFSSGESLKYVVTQSTDMQMSVAGQKQSLTMAQTMDMAWKIQDVAANGDVTMNQVIERVQVSSDGGLIGGFKYDSSDSNPPDSAIAKTMADVFSKSMMVKPRLRADELLKRYAAYPHRGKGDHFAVALLTKHVAIQRRGRNAQLLGQQLPQPAGIQQRAGADHAPWRQTGVARGD